MNKTTITSFASAATALLALFAFWPQVQPAADWFLSTSGSLLQRPIVQAVITAITIGVLLASVIPHLPFPIMARWEPGTTKAVTRTFCMSVAGYCAYTLIDPASQKARESALIFSLLAALGSSAVWTTLAGLLYRFKARPESLK
jgi:hypothetical protein